MSPPYQATPTDQRGDRIGRSHMVTAPRPESRKRRRSRKATTTTSTPTPSRTSRTAGTGDVDLGRDLRGLGEDGHPPLGDREETTVRRDDDVLTGLGADGDDTTLGELPQQGCVAGEDTQLALGRASDDHPGFAGPDLLLDSHQLDLQGRHDTPRLNERGGSTVAACRGRAL